MCLCAHSQCHVFPVSNWSPQFPKRSKSPGWWCNAEAAEPRPRQSNERMWIRVGRKPSGECYSDYCCQKTKTILRQERFIVRMSVDQNWTCISFKPRQPTDPLLSPSLSHELREVMCSWHLYFHLLQSDPKISGQSCLYAAAQVVEGVCVTGLANYCWSHWRMSFMTPSWG